MKKQNTQRFLWIGWIMWAGISLIGCSVIPGRSGKPETILPAAISPTESPDPTTFTDWRTSTPEEQGMDSTTLAKMLAFVKDKKLDFHSILVIRNGFIVSEAYLPPFQADIPHDIASCGKTVAASLLGIALDKGYLKSVDQKMLEFFPDRAVANNDAAKQSITLKHMLTMSAGLEWDDWRPVDARNTSFQMQQSRDPVQFVLDRKMANKPGERWNYSEGLFNMVSTVVSQSTQMSVPAFGEKYLFGPIGVSKVGWRRNPGGGYAVGLTPRDSAKFALLFLNQGIWNGKQVISTSWVNDSTANHIQTGVSDQGYGYMWWLPPFGGYAADGDGGQRIYVVPDKNLIVVTMAGMTYPDMETHPENLMTTYILPAVKSADPLPENKAGVGQMKQLTQELAQPVIKPVPSSPATAGLISGKTYTLKPNSIGFEKVGFNFTGQTAQVEMTFGGRSQKMDIGLDNLYRINPVSMGPIYGWLGLRGSWDYESTFRMDLLADGRARVMVFRFADDAVTVWFKGSRGEVEEILGQASAGNP